MSEKSRTEYSVINIMTGIVGYVINTILGFICRIVFVKCLSADYLGANGLFTNLLTMLSLAELGIGSAIVYALYKPLAEHDEKKIASLVRFYGKAYRIIGIVVAVVGLCMMPFLNVIIREQPDIVESIYLLYLINLFNTASTYFFSYKSSLIIAAQQNYLVTAVNYTVTILQSIIQMIFLLKTHNYLIYLLIQTVGTFSYNVVISWLADKKFPYIKNNSEPLLPEERASLFANIRDLTIYKISGLLVNSTDNILITFFKGLATTGVASNYTLLTTTLNSLLSQVFNGLTASVGNHNALEDEESRFQMFSFLNLMNFWIYGWASLGIIFCSSSIVELCFGKEYILNITIPMVLALNFYTVGMQNAVWTYKQTLGLFRYGRFLQIVTAGLNIFFSVVFGYKFGLFGILFATFLARMFTNLWYDPYAVFTYGFNRSPFIYLKKYINYLIVFAIAAALCTVAFVYQPESILLEVLYRVIVCSLITNMIFYLAFRKTSEFDKFKHILKRVYKLIMQRLKQVM